MSRIRSAVAAASGISGALAALLLIAIMLLIVADVVRRALTDKSIQGAIEVAPLLLLGAVSLGLGQAEIAGTHVRTSLVTDRLPRRAASALRALGYGVAIAVLAWMTKLSYERAVSAYEFNDTTAGFESIPTWPARALVPVGLALWALALTVRLVGDLRALRMPHSAERAPDDDGARTREPGT